ncbi:hypothetical protein AUK14_02715 [Candidatus Berkelbacteria bacterium CG2_30_39_44]|nr:MAG: hypothetical protein AUK14_02715 [Candidatus Berkelbacteria bacterium CG2_30_39_44]
MSFYWYNQNIFISGAKGDLTMSEPQRQEEKFPLAHLQFFLRDKIEEIPQECTANFEIVLLMNGMFFVALGCMFHHIKSPVIIAILLATLSLLIGVAYYYTHTIQVASDIIVGSSTSSNEDFLHLTKVRVWKWSPFNPELRRRMSYHNQVATESHAVYCEYLIKTGYQIGFEILSGSKPLATANRTLLSENNGGDSGTWGQLIVNHFVFKYIEQIESIVQWWGIATNIQTKQIACNAVKTLFMAFIDDALYLRYFDISSVRVSIASTNIAEPST